MGCLTMACIVAHVFKNKVYQRGRSGFDGNMVMTRPRRVSGHTPRRTAACLLALSSRIIPLSHAHTHTPRTHTTHRKAHTNKERTTRAHARTHARKAHTHTLSTQARRSRNTHAKPSRTVLTGCECCVTRQLVIELPPAGAQNNTSVVATQARRRPTEPPVRQLAIRMRWLPLQQPQWRQWSYQGRRLTFVRR